MRFRKRVFAAKAANEIRVEALRIIATRRGEQNWYVLVLGTYESYVDAREAGEAYLHAYPKGSIWVRTAADLKKSLIDS